MQSRLEWCQSVCSRIPRLCISATHARTHVRAHSHAHTRTRAHTHTHTHTHTHARTRKHMHMHTHTYTGNNAVEFGVVPECLQQDSKALHKCYSCQCKNVPGTSSSSSNTSTSAATGFCSTITGVYGLRVCVCVCVCVCVNVCVYYSCKCKDTPGTSSSSSNTCCHWILQHHHRCVRIVCVCVCVCVCVSAHPCACVAGVVCRGDLACTCFLLLCPSCTSYIGCFAHHLCTHNYIHAVGSNLPVKLPLMKGSDIEILVWSGPEMEADKPKRVEFIIKQPEKNAIEMVWHNQSTMPKPYKCVRMGG